MHIDSIDITASPPRYLPYCSYTMQGASSQYIYMYMQAVGIAPTRLQRSPSISLFETSVLCLCRQEVLGTL